MPTHAPAIAPTHAPSTPAKPTRAERRHAQALRRRRRDPRGHLPRQDAAAVEVGADGDAARHPRAGDPRLAAACRRRTATTASGARPSRSSLTDVAKGAKRRGDSDFDDDAQTERAGAGARSSTTCRRRARRGSTRTSTSTRRRRRGRRRARARSSADDDAADGRADPAVEVRRRRRSEPHAPPAATAARRSADAAVAVAGADAADPLPSDRRSSPGRRRRAWATTRGAFPSLDAGPTPAIPTLALPPMPEHPKSGSIVDAVKYLLPLAQGHLGAQEGAGRHPHAAARRPAPARQRAARSRPRGARGERVARRPSPTRCGAWPPRKSAAPPPRSAMTDVGRARMKKEDERWHFDEGERNAELGAARGRAQGHRRGSAQEGRDAARARGRAQQGRRADPRRRAQARATPPTPRRPRPRSRRRRRAAGPTRPPTRAPKAVEARKEATALIPARDAARAEVEKLEGPIAELTRKLTDGRATLVQKKRELHEAKAAHDKTLAELKARARAGGRASATRPTAS